MDELNIGTITHQHVLKKKDIKKRKDIDWAQADLNIILENQRLINEVNTQDEHFKAMSLDIIRHAFTKSIAKEIVSVQSMLGPCSPIYWPKNKNKFYYEELVAVTRRLPLLSDAGDAESYGQQFANVIDREIFKDLLNNTGYQCNFATNKMFDLFFIINRTCRVIKQKINKEPNWLVTSPEVVEL